MKKSLIFVGMLSIGFAYAQRGNVGINSNKPKATLDIQPNADNARVNATTNQGILAPRLSKVRVANIETPVEGTLVYVTDETSSPISAYTTGTNTAVDDRVAKITEKGYYFYNGTEWVKTSATDDGEWVYNDATKTINLKRSKQTNFKNSIYYTENGNFRNIDEGNMPFFDSKNKVERPINESSTTKNETFVKTSSISIPNDIKLSSWNEIFVNTNSTSTLLDTVHPNITHYTNNNSSIYIPTTLNNIGKVKQLSASSNTLQYHSSQKLANLYGVESSAAVGIDTNVQSLFGINSTGTTFSSNNITQIGAIMTTTNIRGNGNIKTSYGALTRTLIADGAQSNVDRLIGQAIFMRTSNISNPTISKSYILNLDGFVNQASHNNIIPNITDEYIGLKIENINSNARNNYAIHTGTGKVRVGDLAQTGAGDRVVYADENGVLKTGGSIASSNGVQTQSGMTCTAENAGKINYTTIQQDGKDVGVFGFCMQKGTDYVWAYMLGGSNIYGTSDNGAAFGQGLQ